MGSQESKRLKRAHEEIQEQLMKSKEIITKTVRMLILGSRNVTILYNSKNV